MRALSRVQVKDLLKSLGPGWRRLEDSNNDVNLLVVHSSDEQYGADRVVKQILQAAETLPVINRIELWLPSDVGQQHSSLSIFTGFERAIVKRVGLPIMRRKYLRPKGVWRIFEPLGSAIKLLISTRPQIIYLGTSACLLLAPIARITRSKHVVLHLQEIWRGPERLVLCLLARTCSQIICISPAVQSALPANLQEKSVVVRNSTDGPLEVVPPARDGHSIRFLIASRWNSWKGHKTLLSAWNTVGPGRELYILGGPAPEGVSVDVPTMVDGNENRNSITIIGEVPDIGSYIEDVDVVIVPSDQPEPFGLIAIEAFARSRPVIGSDGGGLAGIIEHGRTGWKFELGNSEQLASLINGLDRSQIQACGERARLEFETNYSTERYKKQISHIIAEMTEL